MTTIYCTFDDPGLAAIAVGSLRAGSIGIHYAGYMEGSPGANANTVMGSGKITTAGVNVKILCDGDSSPAVIRRLAGFGATRISSSENLGSNLNRRR